MTRFSPYLGHTAALLTQHGKETLLRPVLDSHLGCALQHVTGYDTDLLGSFTREHDRPGSQLDAARQKARLGMELAGLPLGLASEGAFNPDPHMGLVPWDTEIIVWIDDVRGLEVVGMAQGPASDHQALLTHRSELDGLAREAGFPAHGLVLRPDGHDHARVFKDMADWDALCQAFDAAQALSASGQVFAESDLRAHRNPTRQGVIAQAALDLVQRLASACPVCQGPGFSRHGRVPGLPCSACQRPTRQPVAERWRCPGCAHEEHRPLGPNAPATADPSRCDHCNP